MFYFCRKFCLWTAFFFDRCWWCPLRDATIDVTHILIYSFTENSSFDSSHENVIDFFYHRLFQECITSGKKAAAYFGSRSNPTEAVKILRCRCWKVDRHILVWLSLSPSLTHSYSDKMKISSIQTKFLQLAFSLMGRMPHEDFKMLMKNSKKSLKWFFYSLTKF